jgi:hypothetical protein
MGALPVKSRNRGLCIPSKLSEFLVDRILKVLQLHLLSLLYQIFVLHHSITGNARSSQISFEAFIFGGQNPLPMLKLHSK